MKQAITILIFITVAATTSAQDLTTNIKTAKASYTAGKLEDAHFNLQKAMQELDMIIAKEVMKLLPQKIDTLQAISNNDNISVNTGYAGTTIERSYGKFNQKAELTVTGNSPVIAVLNSYFNNPALAQYGDGNTKILKLQGYKARLERRENGNGTYEYEINIPLGASLIALKANATTEAGIIAMANTIPLQQVAKLVQ